MALIGFAEFPGITGILSVSAGLSHGISPGTISITTTPQPSFAASDGDLVMTCGNDRIVFHNCRVDKGSLQLDANQAVIGFTLIDRRFRWRWGEISGLWNQRLAIEGQVQSETLKTPQELAKLCLQAMGERRYDVSQLPNATRPLVNWDHDNPAQALADLCESLGCRVVLKLDDSVAIVRTGVGIMLPKDGATQDSITIDPPDAPDSIKLVGGASRYQGDFLLEAVGLDLDGSVRRINELSYAPANGWVGTNPENFVGLKDNKKARTLALQSVFRWYRIPFSPLAVDGGPFYLPGYGRVRSVGQLFLENEQVLVNLQTERVMVAGGVQEQEVKKPLPAKVYGYYWPNHPGAYGNWLDNITNVNDKANDSNLPRWTVEGAEVRFGFSLNALQHRVEFSQPVYRWQRVEVLGNVVKHVVPAALVLRTACSIRDTATRVMVKWSLERKTGLRNGTGAKIIKHDEVVLTHFPEYSPTNNRPHGVKNNKAVVEIESDFVRPDGVLVKKPVQFDSVEIEANHYLDAAMLKYQVSEPQVLTYHGLRPIDLDGAVQQVGWTISSSGHPSTTASRNNEYDLTEMPYAERRFHEKFWAGKFWQAMDKVAAMHEPEWLRRAMKK